MNLLRLSEMIHLARYEEGKGERSLKICKYYRADYIAIQMIKTFFLVTLAYILILALWAAGHINYLLDNIDKMDLATVGAVILIVYIVILALYLAYTFVRSRVQYRKAKKSVHAYEIRLHELDNTIKAVEMDKERAAGRKK